ncbi:MAG: hypothetical protein QOH62_1841, partial [Solirubrobacteraceae bacterium]|nr:hypothetical protein [Solirubrobacteraceae bacterium]
RVASKAPPGEIYATGGVLERSATRFATVELASFSVKGKKRKVQAWAVGEAVGSRARDGVALRFPFVGRDGELALLEEALEAVRKGAGRLVEISGEAGIGKTRLAEELRERATGMTRLRATCEAYTSFTPYVAWRELLRPLIGARGADADDVVVRRLRATLAERDPELLPWLALLAIPFGATAPDTPQIAELAPEFRRARLHEVVVRFLRDQLGSAALFEIEDGHLMDAASSDLLGAVVAALGDQPWLVVETRRDTEGGFSAAPGPAVVRVELHGLTATEAVSLAEAVTDAAPLPPHALALAAERSGGNPQFLRDLLRAVAVDGEAALPDSIETAAMARIDLLSPPDRALVRRAAVLGLSFHPRDLADVLDPSMREPDGATWDRLSPLFVDDADGQIRFRRTLMRDAAYAGLPFRVRRRLHARVAERLERQSRPEAPEAAESLSLHFARAGNLQRTWRYARIAGDHARDRLAHTDAGSSYRRAIGAGRALRVDPDELATVWEALAGALAHTGELAEASDALRAARGLVSGQPLRVAELLLRHAQVAERAGRVVPAVRWALRGLRALEGLEDQDAGACRARLLSTLATVRQREGRMGDAIALCDRAIAEAEAAGEDAALAHACFVLDWALVDSGRAEEATHSPRALAIYVRLGDLDRQAAVLNNMGGFAYHEGRWDDAVALYRRASAASERAGDIGNAAFGNCNVGELLSDQGHLEDADAELRRALRIWRGSGYEWGTAFATAQLGRVAVRAGAHGESGVLLGQALTEFRRLGAMSDAALVDAYLSEASAFAGEAQRALDAAERLLPEATRTAPLLHRVRGFALAQMGVREAAREAFHAALVVARAQAIDYEVAVSLDALYALCGGDGPEGDPRPQRDALLAKLQVVALPPAPVGGSSTEVAPLVGFG